MWQIIIDNPVLGIYDISDKVLLIGSDENLDNQSNSFTVECKNISGIHKYSKIDISRDRDKIHSGYILNQEDEDQGYKHTNFDCVDWSDILHHRVVAKTYLSDNQFQGRPDLILKDILTSTVPDITMNNIQECPTIIDKIYFPYDTALKSIERILEFMIDWHWFVDANKDFHFFEKYEVDGPELNATNVIDKSLKVQYLGENPANRVWVIGAKQAAIDYLEEFYNGDGQQRIFKLAYEPNFTEIYLNSTLKKSKLESNDDGAQDFLINKGEKVFYIPDNISTPFTGTIKAKYRPTKQIIDYFENYKNIQTYGLFEKTIKNKDITDKGSARQFGKAEIKRKTESKRILSLSTKADVKIGQRCHVEIINKKWDIVGNFLVKSVSKNIEVCNLLDNNAAPIISSVTLEELL